MKRTILRVVVMLLTFALGVVVDWLILRRAVNNTPPTPKVEAFSPAPLEPAIASYVPAAVVAPLPEASPKPHFILDYDPETFNPYGMYYLMGPKPKEFESFEGIELEVFPNQGNDPGYIAVYKRYPDGSSSGPSAVFALITKRRLVFATSKTGDSGIEYRFEGEFLRTDFDSVDGKNIPVLRGVLTRSKDGRTLVERTVSFRFEYIGC
jgi:hypothetical protein